MGLTIFEDYYQPIQIEPLLEPQPLPEIEPQIEIPEPIKKTETQTIAANNKITLEKKWDANRPTPHKALDEIKKLPQPKKDDEKAIIAFKQQRKQIADNAIKNSKPPKFEDFLKAGLNGATASYEYQQVKEFYDSNIKKLKQISLEAGQFPKQILSPGEAVIKINELPRPDRNKPAEIKKYNQLRANIADAALMYNPQPPKSEDFIDPKTHRFSNYQYQEALSSYHESVKNLKEYSQDRYSSTPPLINDSEAEKAAMELIKKHGITKDAINEDQASALGKELANLSKSKSDDAVAIMNKVQEKLNGTDKGDNVAAGFVSSLSDKELESLAQTYEGQEMLKDLKPHLLSGTIHDSEREQAGRIDFAILKQYDSIEAVKQKVEEAYKKDGAFEAAEVLREQTEDLTPEETATALKLAKPTIDKIIAELNDTAGEADDSYDYHHYSRSPVIKPTRSFDQALTDLTTVIGQAAKSPNGAEIVEDFAEQIVDHIKEDGVGRYDEALGKTIAQGGGADLTVEVIKQLKAAGKVDEADDILQNVEDGIKELKDNINDSLEDYAKESQEFQWLVSNWGPMMDKEELQNAIKGYMEDHPELNEKFEALDKLTGSLVRSLNSLEATSDDLDSLDHYDDVQDSVKDLLNDDKVQNLILSMPSATEEISNLVKLQTEGKPTLLDEIKEPSGLLNGVKGFGEKMSNVLLKATVNSALEAKLAGNSYKAEQILDNLKTYSGLLGVSDEDLDKAVEGLKNVQTADSNTDAKAKLKKLNKDLNVGAFAADQPLGRAFRGAGIILSLPGTIDSLTNIEDPLTAARALTDAAGLGTDSAELLAGVLKDGKLASFIESPAFKATGKVLGVVGLLFDGISLVDYLTGEDKDLVGAGLDLAALGGGTAVLFAGGPITLGIGAIVLIGATIGKVIWGNHQESVKYETETTEKFLRDGGINSDVAHELRNQDSDGNSPGPVFRELAKMNNVDPKDFFDYLNTLSASEVHDLVEKAHGVDPDEDGNYPIRKTKIVGEVDKTHIEDDPAYFDLTELGEWMSENGYEDAPGI